MANTDAVEPEKSLEEKPQENATSPTQVFLGYAKSLASIIAKDRKTQIIFAIVIAVLITAYLAYTLFINSLCRREPGGMRCAVRFWNCITSTRKALILWRWVRTSVARQSFTPFKMHLVQQK